MTKTLFIIAQFVNQNVRIKSNLLATHLLANNYV